MFAIGYLFQGLANVIDMILWLYMWIFIIRAALSWVDPDPFNPIVRFIHNVTEPVLYYIRTKVPVNFGGLDLSTVIAIAGLYVLQYVVVNSLKYLSALVL